MSSNCENKDSEFLEYLAHNLADETERFGEDLRLNREKNMIDWSRHFWRRIKIINRGRKYQSLVNADQSKKLEFTCLEEYEEFLMKSSNLKDIEDGDRKLVELIDRKDEFFRKNLECMPSYTHDETIKNRNKLRLHLINLWRMKKRGLLQFIYTKMDRYSQDLLSKIDNLSYEDFVKGDGTMSHRCC